jgi:hypothetical protein
MLPITHCHVALRNIGTGALIGVLEVPTWDPNNDADLSRDLIAETFAASLLTIKPDKSAADNSCGTFVVGPLIGLWEWLDFGEQPVSRNEAWATRVYTAVLED